MRPNKAQVFVHDHKAGLLERRPDGYHFQYFREYLEMPEAEPVSLTLPLTEKPYFRETLFPFFLGLLPEGWYLDLVSKTFKIDPNSHFDILTATCGDCIGAVGVIPAEEDA